MHKKKQEEYLETRATREAGEVFWDQLEVAKNLDKERLARRKINDSMIKSKKRINMKKKKLLIDSNTGKL